MWIYLPNGYSPSAPAAADSTLVSDSRVQTLAQSVTLNGKHSRSRIWLQRYKKNFWMMRLYGAMCEPSTADLGAARWIASLPESLANPTAMPVAERERTTKGISGPIPAESLENAGLDSSSWRMFQESQGITSTPLGQNYETWVTRLRQVYFRRQRLVHPTVVSDFLFWPTPTTAYDAPNKNSNVRDGGYRTIVDGSKSLWPTAAEPSAKGVTGTGNTDERVDCWRTPEATDAEEGVMEMRPRAEANAKLKRRDQAANWSTPLVADSKEAHWNDLNHQNPTLAYQVRLLWPTLMASDANKGGAGENSRPDARLPYVANRFPTPAARDYKDWDGPGKRPESKNYTDYSHLARLTSPPGHTCSTKCRRLNPHFAEMLMGWPNGWSLLATVGSVSALSETAWSRWWPLMRSALSQLLGNPLMDNTI